MKTAFPSLKRFVAWAIASTDSFRFNPFVRATVLMIGLQVVLVAIKIAVFWWAINYVQSVTVDTISEHISLAAQGIAAPDSLSVDVEQVRTRTLALVFSGLVLLTAVFGFLMARFALRPTRNSLQFQKRFIGNVAHEIRTPMAIIKTNTEVALMDPSVSPDVREVFEETITELDRMSETINNLLTFDNLVRPGAMKTVPVDMAALARTVVDRHEELAESRGVSLTLKTSTNSYVQGNGTALEQVVTNLVKNAINYTPKDQEKMVTVAVEHDLSGKIIVMVVDQGIGIAQRDLYHIFEPFYRADTSRARGVGTGSSGLGLAIVNEIVRIHHGSISIRSELGVGTTIRVTLPRAETNEPHDFSSLDTGGSASELSVDFSRPQ